MRGKLNRFTAMTDEEYREFLSALARKHFRPPISRLRERPDAEFVVKRMASTARLNQAVAERSDLAELRHALAEELRRSPVKMALEVLERTGVVEALEEVPDLVFANLRRSAIPDEDLAFMRDAGIRDPEGEMTIVIHYSRAHVGRAQTRPRAVLESVDTHLERAAAALDQSAETPTGRRPRRKLFNGIGKILAGTVTGVGNTLLGAGTITAPNPATAYGVIASAALAVGSICQGIGDLRGE